jgi:nucleotide-binding universal stress UspA family protein
MLRLKRILFPVDFSEHCCSAADAVHGLALRTGAAVTLLHAVRDASASVRECAELLLRDFRPELWTAVPTTFLVEPGDPAPAILHVAEVEEPGILVLSTHGGPVARRILHEATCPVWTDGRIQTSGLGRSSCRDMVDSVFCALSLRELAQDRKLVEWASGFARIWNARLVLLHAVPGAAGSTPEEPEDAFQLSLLRWATNSMTRVQRDAKVAHCTSTVEAGSPTDLLRRSIEDPRAAVIIAGRHHKGLLGCLGSQLHLIVRDSPCPVIAV